MKRGPKIDGFFFSTPGIEEMVMSYEELYDFVNRAMAIQINEATESETIEYGRRSIMEDDYVMDVIIAPHINHCMEFVVEIRTPLRCYTKRYIWKWDTDHELEIVSSHEKWRVRDGEGKHEREFLQNKGFENTTGVWEIKVFDKGRWEV